MEFGMIKKRLSIGLLAFLLVGCGGKAEISGLTSAQVNFNQGKQALNDALQIDTTGDASSKLLDATYKFDTAYKQEPTPERAVAVSVATTLKVENQITKLFGANVTRGTDKSVNLVAKLGKALTPWKGRQIGLGDVNNPIAFLVSLVGSYEPSRAYPNDPTPAQVRSLLVALESDLRKVNEVLSDANIAQLENNPLVFDDPTTQDSTKKVKFGKGDALVMRATSNAFLGVVDLALAWDFGWEGDFDFGQSLSSAYIGNVNGGTTISKSTLLPPSPFGNLYSESASRLSKLKSDWVNGSNDAVAAIAILKLRTATPSGQDKWLSEAIAYTTVELNNADAQAKKLVSDLNGVGTTEVNGIAMPMNITAFVNNPQAINSILPDLTVTAIGSTYTFRPVVGSHNSTVGGLFPNGFNYSNVSIGAFESKGALVNKLMQQVW